MKTTRFGWLLSGSSFLLACQGVIDAGPATQPPGAAGTAGTAGSFPTGGTGSGSGGTASSGGSGGTSSGASGGTGSGASGGTMAGSGGSAMPGGAGGSKTGSGGMATGGAGAGGSAPVTGTGPLCDALAMLRDKCQSCHSSPPALRSIPMSLVSYADLVAPSPNDPSVSTVEACIQRMQDTAAPMPPAPATPATAADVQVLQKWIDAGEPSTCDAGAAGSGGAAGAAGSGGVVGNPYDTPLVCTSNQHWTGGNQESPNMHPGGACISCHSRGEGPSFDFAGTVFPSAHEPDDCNGLNGSSAMTQVVITDASGATFTLNVNSVGNFSSSSRTAPVMPYSAKVVSGTRERIMSAKQTTGDCNSCHTQDGANDAPGRIMAP